MCVCVRGCVFAVVAVLVFVSIAVIILFSCWCSPLIYLCCCGSFTVLLVGRWCCLFPVRFRCFSIVACNCCLRRLFGCL